MSSHNWLLLSLVVIVNCISNSSTRQINTLLVLAGISTFEIEGGGIKQENAFMPVCAQYAEGNCSRTVDPCENVTPEPLPEDCVITSHAS